MWSTAFFDALATGKTIEQACLAADDYVGKNWTHEITTNSWYIAGSKEQSLK